MLIGIDSWTGALTIKSNNNEYSHFWQFISPKDFLTLSLLIYQYTGSVYLL